MDRYRLSLSREPCALMLSGAACVCVCVCVCERERDSAAFMVPCALVVLALCACVKKPVDLRQPFSLC